MTSTDLTRRDTRWSIDLYGFKVNGIHPINDLETLKKDHIEQGRPLFPVLPFVTAYNH